MFKINTPYAILAFSVMTLIYLYINTYNRKRKGFEGIYANALYQLNRNLQIFIQQKRNKKTFQEWRPSAICISKNSLERDHAIKLLDWISYRFGFGTYLHHINGYYSKASNKQAYDELQVIFKNKRIKKSHVFVDTIISPSNTSAIAQAIQIPGITGMENNLVLFEYDKNKTEELAEIIDNYALVSAGNFDVGILSSCNKEIPYKNGIHVWIKTSDHENANLLILLSFIILGHPDWKKSDMKIFEIVKSENMENAQLRMKELVLNGRLPITEKNIELIQSDESVSPKTIINQRSAEAGLTLIGFSEENLKHEKEKVFEGYDKLGNTLFLHSETQKTIG